MHLVVQPVLYLFFGHYFPPDGQFPPAAHLYPLQHSPLLDPGHGSDAPDLIPPGAEKEDSKNPGRQAAAPAGQAEGPQRIDGKDWPESR